MKGASQVWAATGLDWFPPSPFPMAYFWLGQEEASLSAIHAFDFRHWGGGGSYGSVGGFAATSCQVRFPEGRKDALPESPVDPC